MLKIGEGYFIFVKYDDGSVNLLNTFYPDNMAYEPLKLHRLLTTARHKLNQWYDSFYQDREGHLLLGIGTHDSFGGWKLASII